MIGEKIYEIRKRKGLSLSELAGRAKVSKSYISNIERNLNQNPSVQVLRKIASVLDVEMETLLITESTQNVTQVESEWLEFIIQLKETGIQKERIHEFKPLIEFIRWQNNIEKKFK